MAKVESHDSAFAIFISGLTIYELTSANSTCDFSAGHCLDPRSGFEQRARYGACRHSWLASRLLRISQPPS
jgi:hypothetical protein